MKMDRLRLAWEAGRQKGRPRKLSEEQRADVRCLYRGGRSTDELAERFQVSSRTIRRILAEADLEETAA